MNIISFPNRPWKPAYRQLVAASCVWRLSDMGPESWAGSNGTRSIKNRGHQAGTVRMALGDGIVSSVIAVDVDT